MLVVAALLGAVGAIACAGGPGLEESEKPAPKVIGQKESQPYPADSVGKICAMVDSSAGGRRVQALMDSLRWVPGCIPMFTDDQRFNSGSGGWGPLNHALPAPSDTVSVIDSFNVATADASVLVGLVLVDTVAGARLPDPYRALNLAPGFNCVYLRHDAAEEALRGWHAYITPLKQVSSVDFCAKPTAEQDLRVRAIQDKGFIDTADYAPVGRFHELGASRGVSYTGVGFKCVAAHCLIEPGMADGIPSFQHVGVRTSTRSWQVLGWNDEQHVGVAASSTSGMQPQWTFKASIIASNNLAVRTFADFDTGLVHVSTVFLVQNPPPGSKYETKWHYRKGDNYIFIRHRTGAAKDDGWTGVLRHKFTPSWWDRVLAIVGIPYEWDLKVSRTDHTGVRIPGTSRFKWPLNDEDNWARCDEGCCEVDVK